MRAPEACIGLAFASALAVTSSPTSATLVQPTAEIECYLDALNEHDLDRLTGCFAKDATVVDLSRHIVGRAAIRTWAKAEVIGGFIEFLSLSASADNVQHCLVHWAPAGEQGWRAPYTFTLQDGYIVLAHLQYA